MLQTEVEKITGSPLLWQEIEKAYTGTNRHYHNLRHLDNMYTQLLGCRDYISNWRIIMIALAYHDIVYDVLRHDNEEQSAAIMVGRMTGILTTEDIANCEQLILATKAHSLTADEDVNLFTDADLSILGSPADVYKEYAGNIRKEYNIYPDEQYYPARANVLAHFLNMKHIYKTGYFRERLEAQARQNLQWEASVIKSLL